jgi:hypothetical protein
MAVPKLAPAVAISSAGPSMMIRRLSLLGIVQTDSPT